MAKITLEKKYVHDYSKPLEYNRYHVEHDKSGSLETCEVDSVEELIKRTLTEYISQGYGVRTFNLVLEKDNKVSEDDGLTNVDSESMKIVVRTVH